MHDSFIKELKRLKKTIRTIDKDVELVKKLLSIQFSKATNTPPIGRGKIHRITVLDEVSGGELWKVKVATANLKPNLWARMWFAISGNRIILLAIASHKDNYDNNTMDRMAEQRYREYIDL